MAHFRTVLAAFCFLSIAWGGVALADDIQRFDVTARQINNFKTGSDETQFGALEFVGGLEMVSRSRDFGGWSGISLDVDQKSYVGVADTGFWISGAIERDADNRAIGISAQMAPILGEADFALSKWETDAEGIARKGDQILVSFERIHRIARYTLNENRFEFQSSQPSPFDADRLRSNRGFEGIAIAPEGTPLAGALVGVSEKSLDENQNIISFVSRENGENFNFAVERRGAFDVTDLDFLPNGDLVLLERQFHILDGAAMRLRRIEIDQIKEGSVVGGTDLLVADLRHQIDNIEGLSITVDDDGTPRFTLVSDDNHALLQRNLLLEFRLNQQQN